MLDLPVEMVSIYQWSLVLEGLCPICKSDIALLYFIEPEHWKAHQCGGCERIFIDDEEEINDKANDTH